MKGRVEGKIAVVTGAGSGIGAATARRLADEGASVVVADINADAAVSVAAGIMERGGHALAFTVDVADEQQAQALVSAAVDRFGGRIDVLHNNAALTAPEHMREDGAVTELSVEHWDRTLAVNLRGTMLCCKHVIPVMLSNGGGSIINTSSRGGSAGDLRGTAYGVSKAGVDMLTQYIATQYGKQMIRCNALVIVGIRSETLLASTDEAWREMMTRQVLTPYLGTPDDIASAALFLASDESRYVTGHLLAVDGGWGSHVPRYADLMRAMETDGSGAE